MAIATSPTREKYPLSRKKIIKKSLGGSCCCSGFILIGLLVGIGAAADANLSNGSIVGIAFGGLILVAVIILLNYLYQKWYFNVYYYDLGEDFVIIRKGPITPKEINIPYERIQDVYMDQDLLDRMMGLYDVHLSSATFTSGMEAHVDGLEKAAADGLRQMLLTTVSEKINRLRHNGQLPPNPPTPPAPEPAPTEKPAEADSEAKPAPSEVEEPKKEEQ